MKKGLRRIGLACAVSLLLCTLPPVSAASSAGVDAKAYSVSDDGLSYADYLTKYTDEGDGSGSIHVLGKDGVPSDGALTETPETFAGKTGVLTWSGESGTVTWTLAVPAAGYYCMDLLYYALPGKGSHIELSLAINGQTPFRGAEKFSFSRLWRDDLEPGQKFQADASGNQMPPSQTEVSGWQQCPFSDQDGFYSEPMRFYFAKGQNTLSLTCLRETFAVAELLLYKPTPLPGYDASQPESGKNSAPAGYVQTVQAERPTLKSEPSLRADYDRADPLTEPSDPALILENMIGGARWAQQGQWIEWSFTVPESGYYKIGMRYRQNTVRGFFTTRRVYIDGKVPFKELDAVRFAYGKDWNLKVLADDSQPYLFYFEKGETHTIRLEVTTGDMGPALLHLQDDQRLLSEMYRKIIMITGKNPDLYRDYELERGIPGLLDTMLTVSESLQAEAKTIEKTTGFSGSEAALLYRISEQLQSLVKDPYSIPARLSNLGDNISSLAAWVMQFKGQPLELDYLAVMAPDAAAPQVHAGALQKLWFGLRAFVSTFFSDYNTLGASSSKDSIEVWLSTGNEQMTVLRQMIDADFTASTGVPVVLKLVAPALLVQAVMADVGPDVAIGVARTDPVNLAMRGALEPLDGYEGFDEVCTRFMPTAMDPYLFYGRHYGLPDSQTFNMMFVRTDIFKELGLSPPDTWDDLYATTPVLQRNNMEVGLPAGVFNMLLLQNGGSYYNKDKTAMAFGSEAATNSFVQWVELYTKYGYPLFKDDYTRFRTGEMPLTIMPYTFYSQLMVAAPEIRNLWEMYPIPGTKKGDTVVRTDSATGTACVLLARSQKKTEGYRFLNWWTSPKAQTAYCLAIEAAMGTVARYPTATVEAFNNLPWTVSERTMIADQWKNIREIPELPGGYYVSRNLDNAFRASVYRLENPQETLRYWTQETDKEIRRKLDEYHLGPQEP